MDVDTVDRINDAEVVADVEVDVGAVDRIIDAEVMSLMIDFP